MIEALRPFVEEAGNLLLWVLNTLPYLAIYVGFILGLMFIARFLGRLVQPKSDYTSLKTVTFGDESAVKPNRLASICSVVSIFLFWAIFTGSSLIPGFLRAPGHYIGTLEFNYTLEGPEGAQDDATVSVLIHERGVDVKKPEVEDGDGIAKNDTVASSVYRVPVVVVMKNDDFGRTTGGKVVAVNGEAIEPGTEISIGDANIGLSAKGSLLVKPYQGWQMDPLWLPSPEAVWDRFKRLMSEGYQNFTLGEHIGWSLFRVVIGFLLGALVGIPMGYAMGLSNWFRGWFDPIVEFMRPVPPLALIPLVIIWAGIEEEGKIILLFLAALWIMAIAARAGVSGVKISKVHAAYSLGASKWQVMRHVIVPNSLPEIFTGARVAMGVCWGTVVAAELVAAVQGAGMMIMVASRFNLTDIVITGIIVIGIIGYGIDILMRMAEKWLVPWKGRG